MRSARTGVWISCGVSTASTPTRWEHQSVSNVIFNKYSILRHFIFIADYFLIIMITQDSPGFDLVFDHGSDQWVAASSAEKCMFIQILHHLCQHYWESRTEVSVTAPPVGQKPASNTTSSGPASTSSSPASTSTEQTSVLEKRKKKSRDVLRPTEFVNCQSKLLGGKKHTTLLKLN